METVTDFIFLGSKLSADGDCNHEIKRCLLLGRKAMTNLNSILKSKDITWPTKLCKSQSYGFSGSYLWMWELDHKEGWAPKNWCFWIAVLEKILESPLDSKNIKPVNPKGNQPWIFIGRTEAEFWEIVKDREAWRGAVYGVAKSYTRLSEWTTTWPDGKSKK